MNLMYDIVPYCVVRGFIDTLHEVNVYEISQFLLVLPRSILRPVEARFTMIPGSTAMLNQKHGNVDDFPAWAYCLTAFSDLPAPDEAPEQLLDVMGKILGDF